ncbi:hypothetical protein QL995_20970 [Pseudoalteromonas sp. APC 3358]|uniref:hypothetical protein n=1 Tax=Pseudoalteromonas sp. APC 3358 TaxID=3035176 RepID=UPI0025B35195|nr:hypothetical protein [Pseudoalteromonas sp. APC 3358]MDN3385101.1 hypothetical protein [Pseudoalteromonas sp. APC 3358]
MKSKRQGWRSVSVALLFFSMSAGATEETTESLPYKPSPDVSFEKVEGIFGQNINTSDSTLKMLLLAIGMDHTAVHSPHFSQSIGIPFIADRGPEYWVSRLKSGETELEVIVNNALLLLFTKESIPDGHNAALKLMTVAAERGYWPAEFYVAEKSLMERLVHDFSKPSPRTGKIQAESQRALAQATMDRFSRCAQMGFAPCQYRVGFWLSAGNSTKRQGLGVLRQAIQTTMKDTRYKGILDGALILAAQEIVRSGEEAGIDRVIREEYIKLVENYVAAATVPAGHKN